MYSNMFKPRALVALGVFLLGGISGAGILKIYQSKGGEMGWVSGYTTEYGNFVPWQCEHTAVNSDAFPDHTEQFVLNTGPDLETLCNHQGYVAPVDCREPQAPSWGGETVKIDYREQHRVCVTHMPGTYLPEITTNNPSPDQLKNRRYQGDVTRCFDLYDIGER